LGNPPTVERGRFVINEEMEDVEPEWAVAGLAFFS